MGKSNSVCAVQVCDRPVERKVWCEGHYFRQLRGQAMDTPIRAHHRNGGTCPIEGCTNKNNVAYGMCRSHHKQLASKGEISPLRRWTQTAEERFWAKVEKSPGCWNWTAATNRGGYGVFGIGGKMAYAHRVSYEWANQPIPGGMFIDHVCHNRSCVNPDHLRLATSKQNTEYRRGAQSNNRLSGIRGVNYHRASGKWIGRVQHNGTSIHCGTFDTPEEAGEAAKAKRAELFHFPEMDNAPKSTKTPEGR